MSDAIDWQRTRPGPDIRPLDALAQVADAAVIGFLHGSDGACLVWYDRVPLLSPWPQDHFAELRAIDQALKRFAATPSAQLPAEPHWGCTWGTPRQPGFLLQCPYEFPAEPPLILSLAHHARWDADGRCTLAGPDDVVLDLLHEQLSRALPVPAAPRLLAPLSPAWNADEHRARVEKLQAYIAAGDCYQANLAVRFTGQLAPGAQRDVAVARALLSASPAPFGAFFRHPGQPSVISHSPECFLSARGERLASVPIKGTRRRGADAADDAAARAALTASAKERAELAMIVDLVRNDLGRVAVTGSVNVTAAHLLIELPYVHHAAARIEAVRRKELDFTDVLRAAFPAGSITGAPKSRAMAIINELEGAPRGAYCGAFGWLGPGGADLAVAIRTLTVDGDQIVTHAGGGITADSDPAAEWDEVLAKVGGIAAALTDARA